MVNFDRHFSSFPADRRMIAAAKLSDLLVAIVPSVALLSLAWFGSPHIPWPAKLEPVPKSQEKLEQAMKSTGSNSVRLARVMKAAHGFPANVELATLPLDRWVESAFVRIGGDELRGIIRVDPENVPSEKQWHLLGAVVSDRQKLAALVTPQRSCPKGSVLLAFGPKKLDKHHSDFVSAEKLDSQKFCFLNAKSSSESVSSSPTTVLPPIVLQPPRIKLEPEKWPVVELPNIVVRRPTIKEANGWADPQTLSSLSVNPPKILPTPDWRKPEQLPPVPGDRRTAPSDGHTNASDMPPGRIDSLGSVYFQRSCPGPRCSAKKGSDEILPEGRPQKIDRSDIIEMAANALKNPLMLVFVVGSADPVGEDDYNIGLSKRRADRIASEIRTRACPPRGACRDEKQRRLVTTGIGETPTPATVEVQELQRRAEVFTFTRH